MNLNKMTLRELEEYAHGCEMRGKRTVNKANRMRYKRRARYIKENLIPGARFKELLCANKR